MSKKDSLVYLINIAECLKKIKTFTKKDKKTFLTNILIQDAVYRNFEIIGEATKRIPENITSLAPDIPWRSMARFRDVLIHQYDGIDPKQVWKTIQQDLPNLDERIQQLINRLKP